MRYLPRKFPFYPEVEEICQVSFVYGIVTNYVNWQWENLRLDRENTGNLKRQFDRVPWGWTHTPTGQDFGSTNVVHQNKELPISYVFCCSELLTFLSILINLYWVQAEWVRPHYPLLGAWTIYMVVDSGQVVTSRDVSRSCDLPTQLVPSR